MRPRARRVGPKGSGWPSPTWWAQAAGPLEAAAQEHALAAAHLRGLLFAAGRRRRRRRRGGHKLLGLRAERQGHRPGRCRGRWARGCQVHDGELRAQQRRVARSGRRSAAAGGSSEPLHGSSNARRAAHHKGAVRRGHRAVHPAQGSRRHCGLRAAPGSLGGQPRGARQRVQVDPERVVALRSGGGGGRRARELDRQAGWRWQRGGRGGTPVSKGRRQQQQGRQSEGAAGPASADPALGLRDARKHSSPALGAGLAQSSPRCLPPRRPRPGTWGTPERGSDRTRPRNMGSTGPAGTRAVRGREGPASRRTSGAWPASRVNLALGHGI